MEVMTVHVVPTEKGWSVRSESGAHTDAVFSNQKEALHSAREVVRNLPSGQVAVHGKNGRITTYQVHGLPRIQRPPVKSSLGSRNIEKAVSDLVLERLKIA
jgi:hypothetical protein